MIEFEFKKPWKVDRAYTRNEYEHSYIRNYEHGTTVITPLGIVLVSDLYWETNIGIDRFTRFSTLIDGKMHSAFIEESKLSDRKMKLYAKQFLRQVLA